MKRVYVTGAAGFIGSHLCRALARQGHRVRGCDNLAGDAPPALRRGRQRALLQPANVRLDEVDINDTYALARHFLDHEADTVVHLAARAGVRQSAHAPLACARDNLLGFVSTLEACRRSGIGRVLYASSSSVYGNRAGAFSETDPAHPPASVYAATKQADEALAAAFTAQLGLTSVGLRFFTVYGPWGRPDMAPYLFLQAIRRGDPIRLFASGTPRRDFTFIDDVVEAVCRLVTDAREQPMARVLNIGHSQPSTVRELVRAIEQAVGKEAVVRNEALPAGDVEQTCADDTLLRAWVGPLARTSLEEGVLRTARWLDEWDPL